MTKYEATQQQWYLERQMRRWKRENVAMAATGLNATESAAKIHKWQTAQKDFLEQTGRKRQIGREQIAGFGRSQAATVTQSNKRFDRFASEFAGVKTETGVFVGAGSPHVFGQAESRGVSAFDIKTALTTPLKTGKIRADGSQPFIGECVTAVINTETGKLVTAWKTSSRRAGKWKGGAP